MSLSSAMKLHPDAIPTIVQQTQYWSVSDRVRLIQQLTATFVEQLNSNEADSSLVINSQITEHIEDPSARFPTAKEIEALRASVGEIHPPARAVSYEEMLAMTIEVENPVALEDEKEVIADYLWEKYLNAGTD